MTAADLADYIAALSREDSAEAIDHYAYEQAGSLRASLAIEQRMRAADAETIASLREALTVASALKAETESERDAMATDLQALVVEAAHVAVEHEALVAERDEAIRSRDSIASAHGVLIVQAMQYRHERDEAIERARQAQANLETMALTASTKGNC